MIENITNIYILLTFFWVLLNKAKPKNLLWIMVVTTINTVITEILLRNNMPFKFVTNLYFLFTFFLWFQLLVKQYQSKSAQAIYMLFGLGTIITFSTYNILHVFNKMFVVVSSLIYVGAFLWLSYIKLLTDELVFFKRPMFVLLSAPLLFFLGMSLVWGFQNTSLNNYKITGSITLYNFLNICGNLLLYTLINVYVLKKVNE